MKPRIDADNRHLTAVLEALLEADETISVRAVSRAHPSLSNASAFTRDEARMAMIARYQERQREVRALKGRLARKADEKLSGAMAIAEDRISKLEGDVEALVASHVGMIAAVLRAGGMGALEGFWKDYAEVTARLRSLQAMPARGTLLPMVSRP